jgi:hypothetical protein
VGDDRAFLVTRRATTLWRALLVAVGMSSTHFAGCHALPLQNESRNGMTEAKDVIQSLLARRNGYKTRHSPSLERRSEIPRKRRR